MSSVETIYLDHNATTPIRPEVVEAMARAYRDLPGNPASQHRPGQLARRALEEARERIAELLGAKLSRPHADRVVFTSGGTESNNLALLGLAAYHAGRPGHLIVSAIEHASVLEPAEALLERGWRLDQVGVTPDGVVRLDQLRELLREQTRVVSVLLGNHETGVIQPLAEVVQICRPAGVPVHTDAVQAVGKMPIDFRGWGVGALSVGAHKFQGPLGIGVLIAAADYPLAPLAFGGGHEAGLRPGTQPVALAVGMCVALELWHAEQTEHARQLTALRERFENGLRSGYPGLVINGAQAARLPNTSSVAFPGLDGQILLLALDTAGVACSAGSACSSGSTELSPTLRAMGVSQAVLSSSLRFSLGAITTPAEIDEAVARILRVCREIA